MLRWTILLGSLVAGAVALGIVAETFNALQGAFAVLIAFTIVSVLGVIFRVGVWAR